MAVITITIELRTGTRHLAVNSERSAAGYAEAVIESIPREALPVPLTVSCADPGVRNRLTSYLLDLQTECLRMPSVNRNASGALGWQIGRPVPYPSYRRLSPCLA